MNLIITIDTEGDNAWAKKGYEQNTENAKYLPRFQQVCENFGYKPTYLVSYEMAKDDFFIRFARDALSSKSCEVGLHPHPWNQPPVFKQTSDDMKLHPFMIEYPEKIIREKVRILTETLEDALTTRLYSHRAGRWMFNAIYANILHEFGYLVDCSVTPYQKWPAVQRPQTDSIKVALPNYSGFPSEPYYLDDNDISKAGKSSLLEIPVTIIPNFGKSLMRVYESLSAENCRRIIRGIFGQPVSWFRPTRRNFRDMLRIARIKLAQNAPYIMFMLHSSEFMPGGNPQFRNEKEVNWLYHDLERLFRWLRDNGVKGVTCFEFYQLFREENYGV